MWKLHREAEKEEDAESEEGEGVEFTSVMIGTTVSKKDWMCC